MIVSLRFCICKEPLDVKIFLHTFANESTSSFEIQEYQMEYLLM